MAIAAFALSKPAAAQDQVSMQVGGATVSVGAGTAILILPDVNFTLVEDNSFSTTSKQKNSDISDEYGWNISGSVEVPTSRERNAIAVQGFFSRIEGDDSVVCDGVNGAVRCGWGPLIANGAIGPGKVGFANGDDTTVQTSRDVDHWGVAAELKCYQQGGGLKDPNPADRRRYTAFGLVFREIGQDMAVRGVHVQNPADILRYDENLETHYYGAYLAYGGDYSPFLFRGLWSRLGLQSSFRLRGGVYYAETDYGGNYFDILGGTPQAQTLSISRNNAAFIGRLSVETRKKIGARMVLSLKSVYEYYSYVPDMTYNDVDVGAPGFDNRTRIGNDDAFSARTSLRLTIKLDPREIMEPYK